jgi:hypothetical protein
MTNNIQIQLSYSKSINCNDDIQIILDTIEYYKEEIVSLEYCNSNDSAKTSQFYPNITLTKKGIFGLNNKEYTYENNPKETLRYIVENLLTKDLDEYGSLRIFLGQTFIRFNWYNRIKKFNINIRSEKEYNEIVNFVDNVKLTNYKDIDQFFINMMNYKDAYIGSFGEFNKLIEKKFGIDSRFTILDLFGFNIFDLTKYVSTNLNEWVYFDRSKFQKTGDINSITEIQLLPFTSIDIFKDAPVFKSEKLSSGGYLIQLCEEVSMEGDEWKITKVWIELFNYLRDNMTEEGRSLVIKLGREKLLNMDLSDLYRVAVDNLKN